MSATPRSKPLIIGAAINGAEYSPRINANIPVTAADAVRDALEARQAGAGYVHVHAREPRSGDQFADQEYFKHVRQELTAQAPALVLSVAASRKGLVANQILSAIAAAKLVTPELSRDRLVDIELLRAIGMDVLPELMTIFTALETQMDGRDADDANAAIGSYKGTAAKGFTDPVVITAYYQRVLELYTARNIVPEYEVTTMGALWTMDMLARRGWIPVNPHFIFLFGFSARMPISRSMFDLSMAFVRYLRDRYGLRPTVTAGAVMHPKVVTTSPRQIHQPTPPGLHDYLELLEWVVADDTVDCIRVGLEDTPVHFGVPVSNADLVSLVRRAAEDADIAITTDGARVREVFGIRPPGERRVNTLID